ncbi:MAG: hypothetical protein HYT77_02785 [Deltaproteobacteria bacterium]|nr:hypothetical protein [Deltaproteobacteria bacterium]
MGGEGEIEPILSATPGYQRWIVARARYVQTDSRGAVVDQPCESEEHRADYRDLYLFDSRSERELIEDFKRCARAVQWGLGQRVFDELTTMTITDQSGPISPSPNAINCNGVVAVSPSPPDSYSSQDKQDSGLWTAVVIYGLLFLLGWICWSGLRS